MMHEISSLEEINENKIVEQIRCLGIDMIDESQSGHPGIVLGAAPIIYSLFAHHLHFDPKHPEFFNRDRFVMSAGHGSALLYATLFMAGYDLSLDDIKSFRTLGSKTPGHPEYGVTPGVECTTGPIGQGFATAVGMAMAEKSLEAHFNTDSVKLIDYYTYVLCGDGDMMEGITYEAASLAGNLKLNKLIVLYDSNKVCLDGNTSKCFNEDITMRFISQGWNIITVEDGRSYELINKAIEEAKLSTDKPTLIEVKTTIGEYSKLAGTSKVHGAPLTKEDISGIKEKCGIRDIPFAISQNTCDEFRYIINERNKNIVEDFNIIIETLPEETKKELNYFMSKDKKIEMKDFFYDAPEDKKESPRDTSSKILNQLVPTTPYLIGGAADTFTTNKTYVEGVGDFQSDNYSGKNIFFGIREHAMGAILNGYSLTGFRPYASTFLSFSDYMKPATRLAAMMNQAVIYIYTHDSISIGKDGPTHQPVEQLLALRSLPNMEVFRPADANEVIGTYKAVLEKSQGPSTIVLSRNKLDILENTKVNDVSKGGYIVYEPMKKPVGIVISSGEELHNVLKVADRLKTKGVDIRVVSMPNLNRFLKQDKEYIESVLPVEIRKIVVEASSQYSWNKLIYNSKYLITLDEFGTSASCEDVYKKFGFDVDSLEEKIDSLLK